MSDLLGSPRVAPLLFAVRVEPHFSIQTFFFGSSSPTLCARAVTSSFPPQRCLRWGPPLVAGRRGPAPPSRPLEIFFLMVVAKIISSAPAKSLLGGGKTLFFFKKIIFF